MMTPVVISRWNDKPNEIDHSEALKHRSALWPKGKYGVASKYHWGTRSKGVRCKFWKLFGRNVQQKQNARLQARWSISMCSIMVGGLWDVTLLIASFPTPALSGRASDQQLGARDEDPFSFQDKSSNLKTSVVMTCWRQKRKKQRAQPTILFRLKSPQSSFLQREKTRTKN